MTIWRVASAVVVDALLRPYSTAEMGIHLGAGEKLRPFAKQTFELQRGYVMTNLQAIWFTSYTRALHQQTVKRFFALIGLMDDVFAVVSVLVLFA